MRKTALAAACAAIMIAGSGMALAAPFCKTLKEAGVAVGEEASRNDANERLHMAINAWAERYKVPADAKNRATQCKVYIELLNEFECTAAATVCRDISSPKATPATSAKKAKPKKPARQVIWH